MAHGLQIFNADGSLQFDATNRLMRTLTSVVTGTEDGSATFGGAGQGAATAIIRSPAAGMSVAPRVSVSGDTLSWTYGGVPSAYRASVEVEVVVF